MEVQRIAAANVAVGHQGVDLVQIEARHRLVGSTQVQEGGVADVEVGGVHQHDMPSPVDGQGLACAAAEGHVAAEIGDRGLEVGPGGGVVVFQGRIQGDERTV